MDELRIWNTERTAAQIAANKDRMVAGGTAGLAGIWRSTRARARSPPTARASRSTGRATRSSCGAGASWTPRTGTLPAAAMLAETAANATTYTDRTGAAGVRYVYGVAPLDASARAAPGKDPGAA